MANLADIVDMATYVNCHSLKKSFTLNDHLPLTGSIQRHLWLDESQLRVTR